MLADSKWCMDLEEEKRRRGRKGVKGSEERS